MALTPKQNKLLGQLVTAGVPLPVALTVVMSEDPVGEITAGVQAFNTGANAALDAVANPVKTKRKVSAYGRKYKAAFKKVAPRYKLKNGKWKKGGFKRAVKEAHRIAGGKKK